MFRLVLDEVVQDPFRRHFVGLKTAQAAKFSERHTAKSIEQNQPDGV